MGSVLLLPWHRFVAVVLPIPLCPDDFRSVMHRPSSLLREDSYVFADSASTDVNKGLGADMKFRLGKPFRPYEQLMGVLPDRSKKIVPTPYWDLMTSPESPIIDFYPRDFDLDMNGKKMEWEAV